MTTGLHRALAKQPKRVTKGELIEADSLPRAIGRELRAYVRGEAPPRLSVPAFDYSAVLDAVTLPRDEVWATHLHACLEAPEMAGAYVEVVNGALAYLRPRVPVQPMPTLTGVINAPPPRSDVTRFARLWDVVSKPIIGPEFFYLTSPQIDAIAEIYPSLYQAVIESGYAALAAAVADKKSFELPRKLSAAFQRFLKIPTVDMATAKLLQAALDPDQPQTSGAGSGAAKLADDTETQTQRMLNR